MTELPSWAAWRRSHGFGVLCIRSGEGEHFVIVTGDLEAHATPEWAPIREETLRSRLAGDGRSLDEIDESIDVARQWATTVTR
jgi:hypothetical protein